MSCRIFNWVSVLFRPSKVMPFPEVSHQKLVTSFLVACSRFCNRCLSYLLLLHRLASHRHISAQVSFRLLDSGDEGHRNASQRLGRHPQGSAYRSCHQYTNWYSVLMEGYRSSCRMSVDCGCSHSSPHPFSLLHSFFPPLFFQADFAYWRRWWVDGRDWGPGPCIEQLLVKHI